MGIAKTTLEYVSLTTGNWVKAVTPDGNDAVVMLNVEQSINTAAKADIILSNRSPNPTSTVASEAKGLLTDVFSDFQRIRLIHQKKVFQYLVDVFMISEINTICNTDRLSD